MYISQFEEPFVIFIHPTIFFTQACAIRHMTGNLKLKFCCRSREEIIF